MHYIMKLAITTSVIIHVVGCGKDEGPAAPPPPPPAPGILKVVVTSAADDSAVVNSNVVLYQAENGEALLRGMTDADGTLYFAISQGNYYLNISAQGFDSVPPRDIAPLPFFVAWEDTLEEGVALNVLGNAGSAGYVMGYVDPAINNFLILAESQTTQEAYSTASGPDGFFVLFNLPYDNYDLEALKSGFQMIDSVSAAISAPADVDTVSIPVSAYQGSLLTGSVTFLASPNSTVDITLLDPETREVVPGLSVMSDVTGLNYSVSGIPDGAYVAWASLKNDGYVIDPDWLFKNPGGLDITFVSAEAKALNFGVTGAITLVSPTNPANLAIAFMADSQVPFFKWVPYPSTKEYFIEVKDHSGNVLWGGVNSDGTVNHDFIDAAADSVVYNFDGRATVPALVPGEIYQWRLWADKGTQTNSFVEQLISSSEDLRGIFQVPE